MNMKKLNVTLAILVAAVMAGNAQTVTSDIVGYQSTQILPGLKQYRVLNNKGNLVFDLRTGYTFKEHYRVGFMINNLFNTEYSTRPGDIQAPRTFIVQ